MANPFKKIVKNTQEGKKAVYKKRDIKEIANVKVRVCQNCKAPRPADTNLTTCDYCGFKFMDIDEYRAEK